ncbi:MAG: hypothetical protein KME20_19975 [Kaiparowitsia implicata GSE-PSE-MK54-09C]|jgi:hypothetical protein|nr:hypothetical protein [Kaiparowitsia implicata GSE-PSE-MK54-09C]
MTDSFQRPADIVSPIADGVLSLKLSPEQARMAGNFGYTKPTPDNSIVLLIDH